MAMGGWICCGVAVRYSSCAMTPAPITPSRAGTVSNANIAAAAATRIKPVAVPLQGIQARYVRVFAKNKGSHPVYPEGKCWLFIDEIRVD